MVNYNWMKAATICNQVASIYPFLFIVLLLIIPSCKKEASCEGCDTNTTDTVQTNRAPIANAGPDLTINHPANSVQIDGSGSIDPDNNIVSYLWTNITGPDHYIAVPNMMKTKASGLPLGVHKFELKVTDAGGLFSKDTLGISVMAPTPPSPSPYVSASPDIILTLPLDSVYLSGYGNFAATNFQWQLISGPSTTSITNIATSSGPFYFSNLSIVKNMAQGFYTFLFEVGNGPVHLTDTVKVQVIDNPQELNTITFLNLKWNLYDDIQNLGLYHLELTTPPQPNLFTGLSQIIPVQIYLQLETASSWLLVPFTQSGFDFHYYTTSYQNIMINCYPVNPAWNGKESSIKIKIL